MDLLAEPYTPEVWAHPTNPARVVADDGMNLWMSAPMAFGNYRLIGMPKASDPEYQDFNPWWGWCFRGELALMAALNVWDPLVQDEPLGWHKRAGEPRQAPMRHQDMDYNQLRCVHGSYLVSGTCAISEFCEEFR